MSKQEETVPTVFSMVAEIHAHLLCDAHYCSVFGREVETLLNERNALRDALEVAVDDMPRGNTTTADCRKVLAEVRAR